MPTVTEQLAAQNLRPATPTESGWYALVRVNGEVRRVWATDLPGADTSRVTSCLDYTVPVVRS
jgi:hypothetical protein